MKPTHQQTIHLGLSLLTLSAVGIRAEEPLPKQLEFAITKGINPGGKGGYTGTVSFSREKTDQPFKVQWKLSDGSTTEGWGVPYPKSGYIAVAYGSEATGVAIYKVKGQGFEARWALASEEATIGSYELQRGKVKDDYVYKDGTEGTVTIAPSEVEGIANVVYKSPTGEFGGIGIRDGDYLAVGAASGLKDFGVIVYHMEKDLTAKGTWILGGATSNGSETLQALSIDGEKVGEEPKMADKKKSPSEEKENAELAKLIAADFKKCGAIGEEFIGKLKEEDLEGMVALMDDRAFDKKVTREKFRASLEKSAKIFGKLSDFKPDRDKVDFKAAEGGGMNFTLEGDAVYANGEAHEVLRFFKPKGSEDVFLVGYSRTAKEGPAEK